MEINRRIGGWKAKKAGASFEAYFQKHAISQGFAAIRIPDGCIQLKGRIIRTLSPFDYILAKQGKAAFLDLKTRSKNSIGPSEYNQNQLYHLCQLEMAGHTAGYLVFYRLLSELHFYPSSFLSQGKSCKPTSGSFCGNIQSPELHLIWETSLASSLKAQTAQCGPIADPKDCS